jgi:peptidoglycan hydrolase-like protein with peptidoglycan-binding domain
MAFSLTWLPDVLDGAGLKFAEQPGWRTRGRGDLVKVLGVMCHHTAGPAQGNMPSLQVLTNGRPDLPGPLCQLGLGRDGTFYVVAAGRANHAGRGNWKGVVTGNSSFIGIEAENTGKVDDPWPDVQVDAYLRGVAAILGKIGAPSKMCCGHKEYALPPGRKPDPTFDMNDFRAKVDAIMAGAAPPLLIPSHDHKDRPTLRRGAHNELVKQVQTKIKVEPVDGIFGAHTEAAVREFQRSKQIVPDGIVGPKTWSALDALA